MNLLLNYVFYPHATIVLQVEVTWNKETLRTISKLHHYLHFLQFCAPVPHTTYYFPRYKVISQMKPLHRHNIFQVDEIITGYAEFVTWSGNKGQLEHPNEGKILNLVNIKGKSVGLVMMTCTECTPVLLVTFLWIGDLKVVGNEKLGGSGRWQMIDIGLGSWRSMSVFLCILAAILDLILFPFLPTHAEKLVIDWSISTGAANMTVLLITHH